MKFSLVVFDWDGTLMDSTHSIVVSIQKTCEDFGFPIPSEKEAGWVIGLSLEEALKRAAPSLTSAQVDAFIQRYKFHYLTRDPDLRLFDGILPLLDDLKSKKINMAVATGKSRLGLNRALGNHGLHHYFDVTRTSDETRSKPHPQMLEEIMDELMVSPDEVVMIGDTIHDIEMAHHAGVSSIAVNYGAHSMEELNRAKPNFMVDDVAQLHRLLLQYS